MTNNPPIRIYVNKTEKRIRFKIKIWTPEIMKLLGSAKSEITEDGNCENVPHLEIKEEILVNCNIFSSDC